MSSVKEPTIEGIAILNPIDRKRDVWHGYDIARRREIALKGSSTYTPDWAIIEEEKHIAAVHKAYAERAEQQEGYAPSIVPVYGLHENDGRVYFSMQFYNEQPRVFAGKGTLEEKLLMLEHMLDTLAHVHKGNRSHNDAKLGNWVETTEETPSAVLIDFNRASIRNDTPACNYFGTIGFASPQNLLGEYDARGDVFAMGVNAFILFNGVLPFADPNDGLHEDIRAKLQAGYIRKHTPLWQRPDVPASVQATVYAMLDPVSGARPSLLQSKMEFAHARSKLDELRYSQ